MSTAVLPAGPTAGSAVRAETDIARRAARSDREAFEEVYRRHGQASWRLAQAVSPDRSRASDAVAEGFARALQAMRRRPASTEGGFRPQVLAGVYRSAMDQVRQGRAGRSSAASADEPGPGTVLAAFRSLPERWRASLWLSEVEGLEIGAVATILGVTETVAGQLVERGRQGLVARFAQAGIAIPQHLDGALRPLPSDLPASVHDDVARRWSRTVSADAPSRLGPATAWWTERAPKPLSIACGGLVALGMIGLGVLTVSSPPVPSGPTAAISVPGPGGPSPLSPSGPRGHDPFLSGQNPFFTNFGGVVGTAPASAGGPSSPAAAAAAVSPIAAGASAPATPPAPASPAGSPTLPPAAVNPGGGGGQGGGGVIGGGGPTAPAAPAPATPVLTVPNLVTANVPPAGGVQLQLGPPANPIVSGDLGPNCVGLSILNIPIGCQKPPAGSNTGLLGG